MFVQGGGVKKSGEEVSRSNFAPCHCLLEELARILLFFFTAELSLPYPILTKFILSKRSVSQHWRLIDKQLFLSLIITKNCRFPIFNSNSIYICENE